uniref:C2 tensin-type domain-containing protein n=1 Tax=Onchocerca flexuosa TaxID=387005 RepID=A0A183HMQ5_9BILA
LDSKCNQRKAFSFGFNSSFPFLTAIPNETVKVDVKVTSYLPKSLKNFKLHCYMKLFVQNGSQKRTAGRQPHFECTHNEVDGISRFACVWKGDIEVRKESLSGFSMNSIDESEDCLIFQSSSADELKPGENILTLTAKLMIGRSLLLRCDWLNMPEIEEDLARLPICFVHRKPVSVKLKPPPSKF